MLDLVMVKRENTFYRGKVIDYDEVHLVVHFLDYGYTESISRKDIFQWHPRWNIIPGEQLEKCSEKLL